MYFKPSAYRSIIIDNFKPEYEKMKRDCKHKIMVSGNPHRIIVVMNKPELKPTTTDIHTINIAIDLKLVDSAFHTGPDDIVQVIYEPDYYQIKKWTASPEARKAKIKDIFK